MSTFRLSGMLLVAIVASSAVAGPARGGDDWLAKAMGSLADPDGWVGADRSQAIQVADETSVGTGVNQYVTDLVGNGNGPGLPPLTGSINVNSFLGADRFYDAGYTGANARQANIEAGHVWGGHESLGHVNQIPVGPVPDPIPGGSPVSQLGEVDRHATWAGMVMGGRQGGANPGVHQEGIAPGAQLFSGAVASSWFGNRYALSFNFYFANLFDTYERAFETGVPGGGAVDVINSSWGSTGAADLNASSLTSVGLDGLSNENTRTLFVASAGNSGAGPDRVGGPGSNYNNISVAALDADPDNDATFDGFDVPAGFSSGGPNDYVDPVNGAFNNVRQVVDIAAPGTDIVSAYYGGQTGGNSPQLTGGPNGPAGGADFYTSTIAGTSFASPTVAGGASLLYDAARGELADTPDARDARVIKAVLMNSADKTAGWDNGQVLFDGAILTSQGLDNRVGTGRMNLDAAFDQFLSGTTDVAGTGQGDMGEVEAIGWDYGVVVEGTTNDYFFEQDLRGGSTFTATLTWFRDRLLDRDGDSFTALDLSYDDLDLELWTVVGDGFGRLVAASFSAFNNSEHFSFILPESGAYALRVRWFGELFDLVGDANMETYGLAWSTAFIPEPGSAVLALIGAAGIGTTGLVRLRRRRRPAR
ncbi:S8 family serine peptidase [Tautonia plasticadhaerens]|uniref:Subtilase family protein n=1 Tax=Tautonia plasticadhaerens TaxID=2527974 RepID=A0A518GV32_9BACT|nr:S8 family serine peptidase [Tautonia plasticadhaerens]QDV32442.1 Subtilase family protein [Tautonia plasticadhaerens]